MNYIKHLPLALFTLFCLKYLVISPTYTDIMLLGVLGSASSFFEFKIFSKQFLELKDRFEKNDKDLLAMKKELEGVQNTINQNINNIKLSQSLRGQKLG